jgi:hypothetical protein
MRVLISVTLTGLLLYFTAMPTKPTKRFCLGYKKVSHNKGVNSCGDTIIIWSPAFRK